MTNHHSSLHQRISQGNSQALEVFKQINSQPDNPYYFAAAGLSADLKGIDGVCLITGKTCQVKVRQSGPDVLIERWLLYPMGDSYRVEPGRDVVGKADLYICRGNDGSLKMWDSSDFWEAVSQMEEPDWDSVWWAIQSGKTHHLATGCKGLQAAAKLDSGADGPLYGKVLLFVKV
jgi:hypothetical protein